MIYNVTIITADNLIHGYYNMTDDYITFNNEDTTHKYNLCDCPEYIKAIEFKTEPERIENEY